MAKATIREVECTAESEKAILVDDGVGFEQWVPKSVIDDDSEVWQKGQEGDLVVAGWWAKQHGLEED